MATMLNRLAANINCIIHCFTIWPMFQTNHLYMEHGTQFHVRWLNACFVLFFLLLRGNQKFDRTYWENIAHCTYTLHPSSIYLSYTHILACLRGALCLHLLFLSESMAVNPLRIFFCYYNQTLSFFACISILSYIFISFSTFFFYHFTFFGSLLRSFVIRRPI